MNERYPYPDEDTRKKCLERLRESNRQLELYNLFMDDAIAEVEKELRQQKRERLIKRSVSTNL